MRMIMTISPNLDSFRESQIRALVVGNLKILMKQTPIWLKPNISTIPEDQEWKGQEQEDKRKLAGEK